MSEYRLAIIVDADGKPAVGAFDDISKSVKATATEAEHAATALSGLQKSSGGATQAVKGAARSADEATSSFDGLRRVIGTLITAAALRDLIKLADNYGQITSRVRLATQGNIEFEGSMQRIEQIARSSYRSMAEVVDIFTRSAEPMRQLGFSIQTTLDLTEAMSLSLVVGAANQQKSASAIEALSKAMQIGTLQGQEFNTVIAAAPRFAQALEQALGVSRAELRALAADGQLTVEKLALVTGQLEQLRAEAESMPTTVEDAWVRMRDQMMKWAGETNDATAATQLLVGGLELLGNNIDLVGNSVLILLGLIGTRYVATHAAAVVAMLAKAAAARAVAAEMGIAAAATRGYGASLLALAGGPIGVALLAVGGLTAGIHLLMQAERQRQVEFQRGISELEDTAASLEAVRSELQGLADIPPPPLAEMLADISRATDLLAEKSYELAEAQSALVENEGRLVIARAALGNITGVAQLALALFTDHVQQQRDEVQQLAEAVGGLEQKFEPIDALLRQRLAPAFNELTGAANRLRTTVNAGDFWAGLQQGVEGLAVLSRMLAADQQAGKLFDTISAKSRESSEALKVAGKSAEQVAKQTVELALAQAQQANWTDQQIAALRRAGQEWVANERALDRAKRATREAAEAERERQRLLREAERDAKAYADAQERATRALEDLHRELAGPVERAHIQHQQQLRQLVDTYSELGVRALPEFVQALLLAHQIQERNLAVAQRQEDVAAQVLADLDAEVRLRRMSNEEREVEEILIRAQAAALAAKKPLGDEELDQLRESIRLRQQWLKEADENKRVAEESERAWQDFYVRIGRAAAQGSRALRDEWKRMLQELKAQLITSGLIQLVGSLFGGGGGAGGGMNWGQMAMQFMGGGGGAGGGMGGGGMNWLSMFTGGGGQGGLGGMSMTAMPMMAGIGAAAYGAQGRPGMGSRLAAGAAYGYAGYALGTVGLGAAMGATGAAAGAGIGAAAGGAGLGAMGAAAAIPIVGWIIAAMAIIDAVSGGKLFGTKFRPEQATSMLSLGESGPSASLSVFESRQRSLFRGRTTRTRDLDAGDEAREAAQSLFDSVSQTMADAARRMQGEAPAMIDAALRTVQELDKKGKVKSTEIWVDILGRSWKEATEEDAVRRIMAEATIATIDHVMGNTVDAAVQAIVSPIVGGIGDRGGEIGDAVADMIGMAIKGAGDQASTSPQQGEASAIAERWRRDSELLAEGAQFLLAVATDIRGGFDLLHTGTLTPIVDLVEELGYTGESLVQTYQRLAASTQLFEQALAMSGVATDRAREELVRLAVDIAEAAGGLPRAQQLWASYFETFYTAEERAEYALQQAQARADQMLGAIGLDREQLIEDGGLAAFRELFDAVLATGDALEIAAWLEASEAIAHLIGAEQALMQARSAAVQNAMRAAQMLSSLRWEDSLAGMSEMERTLAETERQWADYREELLALGATVEQLAELEELRGRAMERAAQSVQQQIDELLGGLEFDALLASMTPAEQAIARLNQQFDQHRDRLIALGASVEELTRLEGLRANALDRQRQSAVIEWERLWQESARIQADAMREEQARQAERARQLADFLGGLAWDDTLRGMSEADRALAQLNRRWDEVVAKAIALGASAAHLADIERYRQNAIADLQVEQERRLQAEIERRYNAEVQWIDRLRGFRDSLMLDQQVSILTPQQRIDEALRQYDELLGRLDAGDESARGSFQQVAQQLLREGRSWGGSSDWFTDLFRRVTGDIDRLIDASPVASAEEQTITLLARIADAVAPQAGSGVTLSVDIEPVTAHLRELRDEQREGTRAVLVELREQNRQQRDEIAELKRINAELRALREQPYARAN